MCVLFFLSNLVKGPIHTLQKSSDVILVSTPPTLCNILYFNIVNYVSYLHVILATMMRFHVPFKHGKYIKYRSFKNYY